MIPPAVLGFHNWLTVWSVESARLQDANEKKRIDAQLEEHACFIKERDERGGGLPKKEKDRLRKRESEPGSYDPGAEEHSEREGSSADESEVASFDPGAEERGATAQLGLEKENARSYDPGAEEHIHAEEKSGTEGEARS